MKQLTAIVVLELTYRVVLHHANRCVQVGGRQTFASCVTVLAPSLTQHLTAVVVPELML